MQNQEKSSPDAADEHDLEPVTEAVEKNDADAANARDSDAKPDELSGREREEAIEGTKRGKLPIDETIVPPIPEEAKQGGLGDRIGAFVAWVQATRPVRAFQHFAENGGPVMAGGLSYSAIFSMFAGVWALFSAAALFIGDRPELRDALINSLDGSVPGLVGEDGVIKPSLLDQASVFGITGIIALIGSIWTAMGWLAGARTAIRRIFQVPNATGDNFVVMKLKDFGIMLGFIVALVLSSTLTVVSTSLIQTVGKLIGIGPDSPITLFLLRLGTTLLLFLVDAAILATLIRVMSALRIPTRTLIVGSLIGAVAVEILKWLGSALLGGATSNPLAASFGVLLGVMIFFNLLCTVMLVVSAWIKVTMDDTGTSPRMLTAEEADEEAAQAELAARRQRLAAERIRLEEEMGNTPRWKRRDIRRQFEAVLEEERALFMEDKRQRLGLDNKGEPSAKEPDRAERRGATRDAAPATDAVMEREKISREHDRS